ncbi:hypothetical protein SARC_06048 [Sphaeroforma arctica JP610]|uniref:Oxidoreductase n=1 Tax=Sphaeroforma arctica JP610 TaxID=667725 RepID=A0A0L0G0C2_9EUKA|nr:hypothetical protein SARC_06048 [Sphaeroforma arctica JP610]KNC81643.1 hypothetical protein SARC_06048 [Sphaeroforma arctica JP610]|eukprot:XP_014155545.1 hypothetical protein SARC_06048 [Sphaeroforma arctica JP610]
MDTATADQGSATDQARRRDETAIPDQPTNTNQGKRPADDLDSDTLAWREYVTEEQLKNAEEVLQVFIDHPSLRQCLKVPDGAPLKPLFIVGRKLFAPTMNDKKAHQADKKMKNKQKDRQIISSSAILKKKQLQKDMYMNALTPAPDALLLTSQVDDPIPACTPAPQLTIANEGDGQVEGTTDNAATQSPYSQKDSEGTERTQSDNAVQDEAQDDDSRPRLLKFARKCCICGIPYREVHVFYHKMCLKCGDFNYQKRLETSDLSNRTALVTGGRVKIGFYVTLSLLRCGATVIVTTRFPQDAGVRFGREGDFALWKHRLFVYGLDFRDVAAVHAFTASVRVNFTHLDILINNAAQTVRKPPGFYKHLMAGESDPATLLKEGQVDRVDADHLRVVSSFDPHRQNHTAIKAAGGNANTTGNALLPADEADAQKGTLAKTSTSADAIGVASGSATLSQMVVMTGDDIHEDEHGTTLFPEGKLDADLQQIDLRKVTSWVQPLQDINVVEFVECQAINMMAPFVLNSELKGLLDKSPHEDKYIVNVSAMEGQFYRKNKSDKHPHTNMAKAALNMMTRTSGAGYAKDHIYMTSVDTGWITDENPSHLLENRSDPPPLDDVDAAQRILDPIYMGTKDASKRIYGVFLKDYRVVRW